VVVGNDDIVQELEAVDVDGAHDTRIKEYGAIDGLGHFDEQAAMYKFGNFHTGDSFRLTIPSIAKCAQR